MRRTSTAVTAAILVAALSQTAGRGAPAFDVVKIGTSSFTEPNVHVTENGMITVDGPEGAPTNHSSLFRSLDGGTTWSKVDFGLPWRRTPGGGDSHVASRGSRLYFLDLWIGSNTLSVSDDGGATWDYAQPVTTLAASDRQWIALGPRDPATGLDTVYAIYALIQPPRQVMLARSTTGGLTWETHLPIPDVGVATGFTGPLRSDGANRLAFSFTEGDAVYVTTSRDGGNSWTTTQIPDAGAPNLFAGIGLDGEDISVAWIDGETLSVQVAVSHDFGTTFPDRTTLETDAQGTTLGTNTMSWTDIRDGKVAVVWYHTDEAAERPDDVSATALWYPRYSESLDGGATFSSPVNVGANEVAKKGIVCTQGLGCDLGGSGGRELGDFFTVTIAPTGRSVVAFGGRTGRGIRVGVQQ